MTLECCFDEFALRVQRGFMVLWIRQQWSTYSTREMVRTEIPFHRISAGFFIFFLKTVSTKASTSYFRTVQKASTAYGLACVRSRIVQFPSLTQQPILYEHGKCSV